MSGIEKKDSFGQQNKDTNFASQTQNEVSQTEDLSIKIIQSCLYTHLSTTFSILQSKLNQHIPYVFNKLTTLNTINFDKVVTDIKRQIILSKIFSSTKTLLNYYSFWRKDNLQRCFYLWLRNKRIRKENSSFKKIFEEDNKTKISNKKKAITKTIQKKEREITAIKTQLTMINENLLKNNKTIKIAEDKENVFIKNMKQLEEENSKFEKELKEDWSNEDDFKGKYQTQYKELQEKIRITEEETREKDNNYSAYIKEMHQMLDVFERKIKQMKKLKHPEIASHHCKSPNYNSKGGTYTLNSYNGVSTLKGPLKENELNTKGGNKNCNNQGKTYTISTTNKSSSLGMLISGFSSNNCSNNASKR